MASEQRKEPARVRNAVAEPHRAAEAVDLQQKAVEECELPEKQRGNQHAALVQRLQKRFDGACRRARPLQGLHDRFSREAAIQRARGQQIQQREGDQTERKRVRNQQNPEKQHRVIAPIEERPIVHVLLKAHFDKKRNPQSRFPAASSVSAGNSAVSGLVGSESDGSPSAGNPSCELDGFEEGGRSRSGVSESGGTSSCTRNSTQSARTEATEERIESHNAECVPKRAKQTESQAGGEARTNDKSVIAVLRWKSGNGATGEERKRIVGKTESHALCS